MSYFYNEVLLTRAEKDNIASWTYKIRDRGIVSYLFDPIYNQIVNLIPYNISQNVLSFVGLLFTIYAWYYTTLENTFINNIISGTCILMYMIFDAIDEKHANRTMSLSPLDELVDHFCDCITNTLLSVAFCNTFNITDNWKIWLFVLFTQLVLTKEHISGLIHPQKLLIFGRLTGPTEILTAFILLIYGRQLFELDIYSNYKLIDYFSECVMYLVYIFGIINLISIYLKCIKHYKQTKDYATLFGLIFCIIIQIIKFLKSDLDEYMSNGIIFSTLCADIIVCKMANRVLHQLIPVFHSITILIPQAGIPLALIYFLVIIIDISQHMKIPIINPLTNVFVSGYYDGFHVGHYLSLEKASRLGNRLLVGVHSQSDLVNIKKKVPIMTEPERIEAVIKCNVVDKVIRECPLITDMDFIREHKIHIVGMSEEYVLERDTMGNITKVHDYYSIPFKMGILRIVPRTQGVSSSDMRMAEDQLKSEVVKISKLIETIHRKVAPLPTPPPPVQTKELELRKKVIDNSEIN